MNWISVDERLPDAFPREIIVAYRPAPECLSVSSFTWGPHSMKSAGWKEVTHWMELPEPPESTGDSNA